MKKFLVIDGNSIMNRAFYGLANLRMFSKTAGIHTNALYAFLNIYWMILDKVTPDYVAVSFDLKAPTFRHKMYDDYKGTRKGMPDELAEQMPMIKEVLKAMNIPIIEKEGYEADDILGTVANINTKNGIFTYILTGDKDSFQLISDTTSIIIPTTKKGKTEYTIYTPELLMENNNIKPFQIVDIKSLMGDSSDNIPGVKGIGEKTAYSLIWKYETLEKIYTSLEEGTLETTPKIKEKLENDKEMAFLSYKLATIDKEVPIELVYDNAILSDVNKEELYKLFKKLEFTKFLEKYDFSDIDTDLINISSTENNNFSSEDIESLKRVNDFVIIDNTNIAKYKEKIYEVFNEDEISYILNVGDKEFFLPNLRFGSKSIFAIYSPKLDILYAINISSLKENVKEEYINLLNKFALGDAKKIGYNIKQDIRYIFSNGIKDVHGFDFDIMIAYYLLDSVRTSYDIEYILNDLYGIVLDFENGSNVKNKQMSLFDLEPQEEEFLSEADKTNLTVLLKALKKSKEAVLNKLKDVEMLELFNNIEMPLTETLASMEDVGMYIDKEKLDLFDTEITSRLKVLEENIYSLAGEEFNINSTQQLGHILFEVLNLPVIKKGKTGYSTDKEVLEELSDKHEIINLILEYRQTNKLKTTYVEGLRTKIAEDGRIHTTFMQTVTSTGRLSSIEPNLQNIPIRLELGSKIRSFFVAEDDKEIIDADYSQIELRVLAHMSNDKTMIDAFNLGTDIHKVTASQVFSIPLEEVTPAMRSKAKAVNFGIVYGISRYGLAKNISTGYKEAGMYIDNYLAKYHSIKEFMETQISLAKEQGYVSTMFNRRRYIEELSSKNKMKVQFGERVAMNTPIQGSAADIIKIAMNKIYYMLKEKNLKSKLIMQVHDELIIEADKEEIETVKEIMQSAMENVATLCVPLKIDLNKGKSWYDAK